jgi:hypothetical protein
MKTRAFDVAAVSMTLFFIYALVMQYNDPDPYLWMPVYGAAALLSVLSIRKKRVRVPAAILAIGALAVAFWYLPRVAGKQDLFDSEEGREMLGLFITGVWSAILSLRSVLPR